MVNVCAKIIAGAWTLRNSMTLESDIVSYKIQQQAEYNTETIVRREVWSGLWKRLTISEW